MEARTQEKAIEAAPANVEFPATGERERLADRLQRAKHSFVTRRVELNACRSLGRKMAPESGDLVLATVTELGHHARLENVAGRRSQLYVGDEIVVAYGARYAPDQFEAVVPNAVEPCHLVAGGGIAARVQARHSRTRKPTEITPIGLLIDAKGQPLNLRQFALPTPPERRQGRSVLAVVGTSMNAGKTTLAASLIRGLTLAGVRVGACKLTGTGSGGDIWSMIDAGAVRALDFTDVGYSTTAGADIAELSAAANALISHVESDKTDIVVAEIADGLFQRETAALLDPSTPVCSRIDGFFLAAADSMGAFAGVKWLRERNLPLRAVSGLLTASPLATREARAATGLDIVSTRLLTDPDYAAKIALQASQPRSISVI